MSTNNPMPAIRGILGMPKHDEWDGNGWKNGQPVDETDYAAKHRDGATRGDFVRANYYATLLLLQQQRALVQQQRVANIIARLDSLTHSNPGEKLTAEGAALADRLSAQLAEVGL